MSIFAPSSNSFRKEAPDEKTLLVTRKHRINLWAPLYAILGLSCIPFLFYALIRSRLWYPAFSSLFWFVSIIFFLFIWNLAFYWVMLYFLNTVIVTNKRVIENEQKGFFDYERKEIALDKIQDISVEIKGSMAHFFDFGDIEIQSAGREKKFFFTQLPSPEKIKETIMSSNMKG